MATGEGVSLVWLVPPSVIAEGVERWGKQVLEKLFHNLQGVAAEIEAFAKANHPWSNVTGAAEAGLSCEVFRGGDGMMVVLYHQAPHGIWLEVKYGGRWGIIPLATESHYGDIMQAAQDALS